MSSNLDTLLSRPDLIWRPGERRVSRRAGVPTGYVGLDSLLRDRGWPRGALVELLAEQPGTGELRLLLPALGELGRSGLYQLWIDPPFIPFGPALAAQGIDLAQVIIVRPGNLLQWLWAAEQALRSPGCGAVVCWAARGRARYPELRKLQVAAAERQCIGFLFGASHESASASPAVLRLAMHAAESGLQIEILKQRGAAAGQRFDLEIPLGLRPVAPLRERPAIISAPQRPLRSPLRESRHPVFGVQAEAWQ
jgi:cell division inhibitor SulA/protein ImuA